MHSFIASPQYKLSAADLEIVLALVRDRTLAAAGERLALNASTVFRQLQRIERALGAPLFIRSRKGYEPGEAALLLAEQAEQIEAALDAARAVTQQAPGAVSGTVRLTTTDTLLHVLVAPSLATIRVHHPMLVFDLHTGNELASLTRRDADIAVRATKRPPLHLVGKPLGVIHIALYAPSGSTLRDVQDAAQPEVTWVAPDEALPEHPSVLWRRKFAPRVSPRLRVSSVLTVAELVASGLGVGVLPLFLAENRSDLVRISEPMEGYETDLWLLTHPEARHLRRVSTVYSHLADTVRLPPL